MREIARKKSGCAIIDEKELMNFRTMNTTFDFGIMCILKEHGAPIDGVFDPIPDMVRYFWEFEVMYLPTNNGLDRKLVYKWKEI